MRENVVKQRAICAQSGDCQPNMNRNRMNHYHRYETQNGITFFALVQQWRKEYVFGSGLTPSTQTYYQYVSDNICDYFGAKIELRDVSSEKVKEYITFLQETAKTKRGKPYSKRTIHHHYRCLVTILEYARRKRLIGSNPCDDLTPHEKPQKEIGMVDFLTALQAREFLRCLEAEPLYWRCLMNLLITSGLRRGEAIGLQWRDLNGERMTIKVERNVTIDKDAPEKYRIGAPKGKRSRVVPVSERVYLLLMELYAERQCNAPVQPEDFIFNRASAPGKPLYPTEPTRWQRKFVERHGLRKVSPHDLRHTAATLALEGGATIKAVSTLLGHADPATTLRYYAGVSDAALQQTVNDIECLIKYQEYEKETLIVDDSGENVLADVEKLTNQILQLLSKAQRP